VKLTALSVVVVCLSLQTGTAVPLAASEVDDSATIYFYRGAALTNAPASAVIDDDVVCSVRPEMFCVVEVRPGKHGVGQGGFQENITVEPGHEYYSTFKPIHIIPWEIDPGWRLVPSERGQKEIRGLKREEIVVPPGVFPRNNYNYAHLETIQLRLGERVEMSFVYSYTNESASDCVLTDSSATLVEEKYNGEWVKSSDYHLKYPLVAPAGKRVLLIMSVSSDYWGPLRKGEEPSRQTIASFLKEKDRTNQFFVFDPSNRMKVRFLVSTDAFILSSNKAFEIVGHFPEYFAVRPERKACFEALGASESSSQTGGSKRSSGDWTGCLIDGDTPRGLM